MICIFDIETTGTINQRPIEFTAMCIDNTHLAPIGKYLSFYLDPCEPIMPHAAVVHGLTVDKIQLSDNRRLYRKGLQDIIAFFDSLDADTFLCGYNTIKFDCTFLNKAIIDEGLTPIQFDKFQHIDLLQVSKKFFPVSITGDHKLSTIFYVCYPNSLDRLLQIRATHGSYVDCNITKGILRFFLNRFQTPENIIKYLDTYTFTDEVPIGKHKGEKISTLMRTDRGFLRWALSNEDICQEYPDFVYSIRVLIDKENEDLQ